MLRIVLGTVLGAVVFFMWGALAWMVLQLYDGTIHTIPDEDRVMQVLREAIPEPGVYVFPNFPETHDQASADEQAAMMEQWKDRHRAGPIGFLSFQPAGSEPMPPRAFINGFGLNLCMALLGSLLLASASIRWYLGRVLFVAGLGLTIGVATHMMHWNWMHFPLDYSLMQVVDSVVGWSLAGVVIGAVVRPVGKASE